MMGRTSIWHRHRAALAFAVIVLFGFTPAGAEPEDEAPAEEATEVQEEAPPKDGPELEYEDDLDDETLPKDAPLPQEGSQLPRKEPTTDAPEGAPEDVPDPRTPSTIRGAFLRGWDTTRPRWFVSARADMGFLFVRPRASFGYGIPHENWTGFDIVPILSSPQAGVYSGFRYRHPRIELRTGGLLSYSFRRSYLEPAASYDARDIEILTDDHAEYFASDSELTFNVPMPFAYFESETQVIYLLIVADDKYVFVDALGVVVAPPISVRQRVVLDVPISAVPGLFVGPAVEAVITPGRSDPWVLRAGGLMRFEMVQDLDIHTEILPTIKSPDRLGRAGAPWLEITVQFRWATN